MNYYFPYGNMPYMVEQPIKQGLISSIFKNKFNWSNIISNTQKTLNIINQTIPIIKQAKPVVNNAKTMFKIMNEFKKVETPPKKEKNINPEIKQEKINQNYENPKFFL